MPENNSQYFLKNLRIVFRVPQKWYTPLSRRSLTNLYKSSEGLEQKLEKKKTPKNLIVFHKLVYISEKIYSNLIGSGEGRGSRNENIYLSFFQQRHHRHPRPPKKVPKYLNVKVTLFLTDARYNESLPASGMRGGEAHENYGTRKIYGEIFQNSFFITVFLIYTFSFWAKRRERERGTSSRLYISRKFYVH